MYRHLYVSVKLVLFLDGEITQTQSMNEFPSNENTTLILYLTCNKYLYTTRTCRTLNL